MNRALGIALIVVGAVLLFYGFKADNSFSSEISKFFSGDPTDRTLWLFLGGAGSIIAGAFLTASSNWRTR